VKDLLDSMIQTLSEQLEQLLGRFELADFLQALVLIVFGWVLARLLRTTFRRFVAQRFAPQQSILFGKIIYWVVLGITTAAVLSQLGVNLNIFLGAAGILTVALGFASQTAASNLISGLFLMGERPFVVGDLVRIGNLTGEVISIDLLSMRIRTFDNLMVRLPNEMILKSEITTLTAFPIRRLDVRFNLDLREDVDRVREILTQLADDNPLCLDEPRPSFFYDGFKEGGFAVQYSVWMARENYFTNKNRVYQNVKEAFDEHGIRIAFPTRTLHFGRTGELAPLIDRSSTET